MNARSSHADRGSASPIGTTPGPSRSCLGTRPAERLLAVEACAGTPTATLHSRSTRRARKRSRCERAISRPRASSSRSRRRRRRARPRRPGRRHRLQTRVPLRAFCRRSSCESAPSGGGIAAPRIQEVVLASHRSSPIVDRIWVRACVASARTVDSLIRRIARRLGRWVVEDGREDDRCPLPRREIAERPHDGVAVIDRPEYVIGDLDVASATSHRAWFAGSASETGSSRS